MNLNDCFRLFYLILKILQAVSSAKASKASRAPPAPMIRREITTPDGRKGVFEVFAIEPPLVSIKRMYPPGVMPPTAAQSTHRDRPLFLRKKMTVREKLFGVGLAGVIGVIYMFGFVRGQPNLSTNAAAAASSYQAAAASGDIAGALAPGLPRVRLKTGANVRNGPSRSAVVLRVGQQGEVFTKFGESNGWLHVGTDQPKGWIAQSVAAPAN